MEDKAGRGARILATLGPAIAQLEPDDRAWLEERVEERWRRRQRRLDDRDVAVRELRRYCREPDRPSRVAAEITSHLSRYLCSGWRKDQIAGLAEEATAMRKLLYRIASARDGRALSPRQVMSILLGKRV